MRRWLQIFTDETLNKHVHLKGQSPHPRGKQTDEHVLKTMILWIRDITETLQLATLNYGNSSMNSIEMQWQNKYMDGS